jgi:hypothetical protein
VHPTSQRLILPIGAIALIAALLLTTAFAAASPSALQSPTLTIADVRAAEASGAFTFTATLNVAATAFTVNWGMLNGTTSAADFSGPNNGTITFAGTVDTVQFINIPVQSDSIVELDETFTVRLTRVTPVTPLGITITDTGAGTIQNHDSAVVTVSSASGTEGDSGTKTLTLNVTLSNPVDANVTVRADTVDNTATAGLDYVAIVNQTVSFIAGATIQLVMITINGDLIFEGDETFWLGVSNRSASGRDVTIGGGSVGTIIENDPDPSGMGNP